MTDRLERVLASRQVPAWLGVASGLFFWWVWGSLRPPAVISDESAYLLQAEIFASGHWTAPPPPLPEFFEQMHVLVTPVFASKYPPGHSLLLVPGVWIGLPALISILLTGVAAALVFALARRVAGPWVGLATWLLWTTAPGNLHFRTSYFAQMTTSALWLLGWWFLLRWRESGRGWWLVLLAVATAWGAATRPFTMLLFGIPVAAVVVVGAWKRRAWRQLGVATAAGLLVLGILPLWDAETTGDWRRMPLVEYNQTYLPSDTLGFNVHIPPPRRALPPDQAAIAARFERLKLAHVPKALPKILAIRLLVIGADMWDGWRALLIVFAGLGILRLPPGGRFAIVSVGIYVLGHLAYCHSVDWSLYYLEILPVLAFVTANGLSRLRPKSSSGAAGSVGRPEWKAALVAVLLCVASGQSLVEAARLRAYRRTLALGSERFEALLASVPESKAIVFVRYSKTHDVESSLISNAPDLAHERVWRVYDRGADDARLVARAPDRAPYVFDEATGRLGRLRIGPPSAH